MALRSPDTASPEAIKALAETNLVMAVKNKKICVEIEELRKKIALAEHYMNKDIRGQYQEAWDNGVRV